MRRYSHRLNIMCYSRMNPCSLRLNCNSDYCFVHEIETGEVKKNYSIWQSSKKLYRKSLRWVSPLSSAREETDAEVIYFRGSPNKYQDAICDVFTLLSPIKPSIIQKCSNRESWSLYSKDMQTTWHKNWNKWTVIPY